MAYQCVQACHGFMYMYMPDKKVLLTNGAQPPAVTLGRAVATTRSRPIRSVTKSFTTGSSRSSDETHLCTCTCTTLAKKVEIATHAKVQVRALHYDARESTRWRAVVSIFWPG